MLAALIPVIGSIIDKIFPDATAASAAKARLIELEQQGALAALDADVKLALGQLAVNQEEAKSENLFKSGWRPFVGWTCGSAFALHFVLLPIVNFVMVSTGHAAVSIPFDIQSLLTVLLGMLGLGGMRSWEKYKGVS